MKIIEKIVMKTINDNGYEKVEYILACTASAKKSWTSKYENYRAARKDRYKTALAEAKRAQAEDYYTRRTAADRYQA